MVIATNLEETEWDRVRRRSVIVKDGRSYIRKGWVGELLVMNEEVKGPFNRQGARKRSSRRTTRTVKQRSQQRRPSR